MRLYLAGNGEREKWLREEATLRGHTVTDTAFDAAVMKLPFTEYDEELAGRLPDNCRVICGRCDGAFLAAAKEKGWRLYPVLEDEAYIEKNAALTAEGAICFAMERLPAALADCRCLVIGYGRIGRSLVEKLRGLGACVHAAARRKESREAAGEGSLDIPEIPSALAGYDVVFNTVPFPILTRETLKNARQDSLLIELASAPYGIDLAAAKTVMGLQAYLESGVPGRYCPRSAAKILMEYIERSVRMYE